MKRGRRRTERNGKGEGRRGGGGGRRRTRRRRARSQSKRTQLLLRSRRSSVTDRRRMTTTTSRATFFLVLTPQPTTEDDCPPGASYEPCTGALPRKAPERRRRPRQTVARNRCVCCVRALCVVRCSFRDKTANRRLMMKPNAKAGALSEAASGVQAAKGSRELVCDGVGRAAEPASEQFFTAETRCEGG